MRRDQTSKAFKHSVFVEFAKFDEMEKFVALGQKEETDANRPKWEDGTVLKIMTK